MRRFLVASFSIIVLSGCETCDERLEQALFNYMWASESQTAERTDDLSAVMRSCQIPREGISNRLEGNTHAAEMYLIVGDYDSAAESLSSGQYDITDSQQFDLVSFAATHQDPDALELVINSGVDPKIRQPHTEITTIMHASQSAYSAVERMKLLESLGVDPLAVSRDGFSALDFSIADGQESSVEQVLSWIDAGLPESQNLVIKAIGIAEESGNVSRAKRLRDWLSMRSKQETE